MTPRERDEWLSPQRSQHLDLLVEDLRPLGEVDAECLVLDPVPSNSDSQAQATSTEQVDRRHLLRDHGSLPLRQDHDTGDELQCGRDRSEVTEQHQDLVKRVLIGVRRSACEKITPTFMPSPPRRSASSFSFVVSVESATLPLNSMSDEPSPADRWGQALLQWGIPQAILDQAPESPWIHPPAMFVVDDHGDDRGDQDVSVSHRWAREALAMIGGRRGTVLDVGCGGGRSSVPLAASASRITGVDGHQQMLDNFAAACAQAGVAHREVLGSWPQVAAVVDPADVVVCHHVVYNVGEIAPFVRELAAHARRRVVVELPLHHPTSPFDPLWKRFWNLDRPDEPSAELFVDVVRSLGFRPRTSTTVRSPRKPSLARAEYVAFVRRRLCLSVDRDVEIDAALGEDLLATTERIVTVSWDVSPSQFQIEM